MTKQKILNSILVMATLISFFVCNFSNPITVFASGLVESSTTNEVVSLRQEFEKHFQNADGTITAASYATPVHYKNDDGNWIDIDNTLVETTTDKSGNRIIENKDNPLKVKFSNKSKDKKMVSIKLDKYEINWGIENVEKNKATIIDNSPKKIEKTDISTLSSKISYEDIFENTSLTYTLHSYSLKEELTFDKVPAYNQIVYNIEVKNVVAELVNNEVIFYDADDNQKEIFKFNAPFMVDSAEKPAYTENVQVKLEETKQGYTIIHIFDMEWLKSEERVYPVVLDPVVTSSQAQTNIEDTHVNSNNPNTNYVMNTMLVIGNTNGFNNVWIKITNLPSIPSNGVITDARLVTYLNYGTTTWGPLEIWEVRSAWDSYTMTYNLQNNVSVSFLANNIYPSGSTYYNYNINVTSTVQKWYSGELANWGFMLRYQYDDYNDYNWMYSSDNLNISSIYKPAITITYTIPAGANPYANFGWVYPFSDTSISRISSGYKYDRADHNAIDLPANLGTPIRAAQSGTVAFKWNFSGYTTDTSSNNSAGNWVVITTNDIDPTTGNRLSYGYKHMQYSSLKNVGDTVTAGEIIGYVGSTGYSTGAHLHMEVIRDGSVSAWGKMNSSVNPEKFYPSIAFSDYTTSLMY